MNKLTNSSHMAHNSEFVFTQANFREISKFAHQNFGLNLPETKFDLVYSRLIRRFRALNISKFDQYLNLVRTPEGAEEKLNLLSALTTNVTHFFREPHHFDTLRETVLPPLLKAAESGRKIRIWSAGCSTGQEPYSIALTILDLCPNAGSLDIKILGTDIDPVVVKKAEQAVYDSNDLSPISKEMRDRDIHFPESLGGQGKMKERVRNLVSFGRINLIEPLPISGPLDAIFCRNVAIYFDKETQQMVWRRFRDLMGENAYLFIGHSERLSGDGLENFENVGITTYVNKR